MAFVRHGSTLVRAHKCRLQNAPLLGSSTGHLTNNIPTHARKEDDENQLINDISVEQEDDSDNEPPNDNFGKEDDVIKNQMDIEENINRRDPTRQKNITVK